MLAPFVLVCLFVIPGRPGTARAAAAARAGPTPPAETEVVPVGHPQSLLLLLREGGRRTRYTGPNRGVSRAREDIQLLAEAAVGADIPAVSPPSQEGLRADPGDGAGEEVVGGAAVAQ